MITNPLFLFSSTNNFSSLLVMVIAYMSTCERCWLTQPVDFITSLRVSVTGTASMTSKCFPSSARGIFILFDSRWSGRNICEKWTNFFFYSSSSKWRSKLKLTGQGNILGFEQNLITILMFRAGRLLFISTYSTTTTVTTTTLCWKANTVTTACTGRRKRSLLTLDEELQVSPTRWEPNIEREMTYNAH